jgi:hypothetical protein
MAYPGEIVLQVILKPGWQLESSRDLLIVKLFRKLHGRGKMITP